MKKYFMALVQKLKPFYEAIRLFHQKRGTSLAAASTFYLLLTAVPLLLLIMRVLGFFINNKLGLVEAVFDLGMKFFPEFGPQMLASFKRIIKSALFARKRFTYINLALLTWSSLTYFNSLWDGLFVITGDRKMLSFWNHIRGVVLIALTMVFLGMAFAVTPLLQWILEFFQSNPLMAYLMKTFPTLKEFLGPFVKWKISNQFLIKSQIGALGFFFFYFVFLFRGLFNYKINYKSAAIGAFIFISGMGLSRALFWIYIENVRTGLIRSYGDYYTLILGLIWVYFVMGLFFMGLCFCHVFSQKQTQGRVV